MSGTLYVVPTPIGNLGDITLRAIRVLGEVQLVAAEDTRLTRGLLTHLGLHKPLVSYHQHGKIRSIPRIQGVLRDADVALVSDAGMPSISDPGFELIRSSIESGFRVEVLPGPSSVTAAVALAALPSRGFIFAGFLPRRRGPARAVLTQLAPLPYSLVLFEAPHRLRATVELLLSALGDRPVVAVHELSKVHASTIRGTLPFLLDQLDQVQSRGEWTLVVGGAPESEGKTPSQADIHQALQDFVQDGASGREAVKQVSDALGVPRSEVYRVWAGTGGGRSAPL